MVWFTYVAVGPEGRLLLEPDETLTEAYGRTEERAWRACELKLMRRLSGARGWKRLGRGHVVGRWRTVLRMVMRGETWRSVRGTAALGVPMDLLRRAA